MASEDEAQLLGQAFLRGRPVLPRGASVASPLTTAQFWPFIKGLRIALSHLHAPPAEEGILEGQHSSLQPSARG